jgi:hypothetical protein
MTVIRRLITYLSIIASCGVALCGDFAGPRNADNMSRFT